MDFPSALTAELVSLTEALDSPRLAIVDELHGLIADIRLTNDSYVGLTLTVVSGGVPFTIVALDDGVGANDLKSSAYVPLTALCDVEDGSALVFFADTRDAFSHLAGELSSAMGIGLGEIELDRHLRPPPRDEAMTVIAATRQVNQALGVLIERGRAPAEAHAELRRLAEVREQTLAAAAALVIGSAGLGPVAPRSAERS